MKEYGDNIIIVTAVRRAAVRRGTEFAAVKIYHPAGQQAIEPANLLFGHTSLHKQISVKDFPMNVNRTEEDNRIYFKLSKIICYIFSVHSQAISFSDNESPWQPEVGPHCFACLYPFLDL